MQFKEQKAIYLQIAHRISDEIVLGQYVEEGRIPSVREYAGLMEVNANTVMRAFDYLQNKELIFNQRGRGNFVAKGARKRIIQNRQDQFLSEDLTDFFHKVYTLGIPMNDIVERYKSYQKNLSKNK